MKRDKALLPFGGYNSLAQYQYQKFKPFFSKVYLSAKDNKFNFDVDIIKDIYDNSSPLVALISIFETLKDIDEVAILSVDSPFIQPKQFEILFNSAKKESDIIVAESPNGIEPLCGIYRRTILPIAKEMLRDNRHRLMTILDKSLTQKVLFKKERLFINLNYPKDYKIAKKLNIFS